MVVRQVFFVLIVTRSLSLVVSEDSEKEGKPLCCSKLTNGSFSNHCQRTRLWASGKESYATTPNFPGRFPILKKCIWDIYTLPGKRIKLEFRDFYLIGPGDNGICYSQNVIIKSPLSGLQVGPHCGNAGIPSVVSAGNYLVVELISNIPMTSENYRGFRMAFTETAESANRQLVSQHMKDDVIVSDGVMPNGGDVTKPTIPSKKVLKSTTRKPSRVRLGKRPVPLNRPGQRGRPTNKGHPRKEFIDNANQNTKSPAWPQIPHDVPAPSSNALSPMVIVGIAAGGIILLALCITLAMKFSARSKKKHSKGVTRSTKPSKSPRQETHQPDIKKDQTHKLPMTQYYVYFYRDRRNREGKRKHSETSKRKRSSEKRVEDKSCVKVLNEIKVTSENHQKSAGKIMNKKRKAQSVESLPEKKLTPSALQRQRDLAKVKKTKSICAVSSKSLAKNPGNRCLPVTKISLKEDKMDHTVKQAKRKRNGNVTKAKQNEQKQTSSRRKKAKPGKRKLNSKKNIATIPGQQNSKINTRSSANAEHSTNVQCQDNFNK